MSNFEFRQSWTCLLEWTLEAFKGTVYTLKQSGGSLCPFVHSTQIGYSFGRLNDDTQKCAGQQRWRGKM